MPRKAPTNPTGSPTPKAPRKRKTKAAPPPVAAPPLAEVMASEVDVVIEDTEEVEHAAPSETPEAPVEAPSETSPEATTPAPEAPAPVYPPHIRVRILLPRANLNGMGRIQVPVEEGMSATRKMGIMRWERFAAMDNGRRVLLVQVIWNQGFASCYTVTDGGTNRIWDVSDIPEVDLTRILGGEIINRKGGTVQITADRVMDLVTYLDTIVATKIGYPPVGDPIWAAP